MTSHHHVLLPIMISPHADSLLHHTQPDGKTPRAERRGGLANPRARASRTQERGAERRGCRLSSRPPNAGFSGFRAMRVEVAVEGGRDEPTTPPAPIERVGWAA